MRSYHAQINRKSYYPQELKLNMCRITAADSGRSRGWLEIHEQTLSYSIKNKSAAKIKSMCCTFTDGCWPCWHPHLHDCNDSHLLWAWEGRWISLCRHEHRYLLWKRRDRKSFNTSDHVPKVGMWGNAAKIVSSSSLNCNYVMQPASPKDKFNLSCSTRYSSEL